MRRGLDVVTSGSVATGSGWWVDGKREIAMLFAGIGVDLARLAEPPTQGLFVALPVVFLPTELPPPSVFVQSLGIVPGIMLQRDPEEVLWAVAQIHGKEEDAVGFDVTSGRLEAGLSSFAPNALENALRTGLAVIERQWPSWPLTRIAIRPIGLVVERPARPPAPPVPEA